MGHNHADAIIIPFFSFFEKTTKVIFMKTLERSHKLLAVLKKREQTPEMLARIARVENEIQEMRNPSIPLPTPIPAPDSIIKKKKKLLKTIEIEEDDEE
jgi:hypothetical protein